MLFISEQHVKQTEVTLQCSAPFSPTNTKGNKAVQAMSAGLIKVTSQRQNQLCLSLKSLTGSMFFI